jgi:Derlin-2/3
MAQDLESFFAEMPVVTKYWLFCSFFSTLAVMLNIITPFVLILDLEMVWQKFQIWRLFTCSCFFGKFSMPFCFQLYFLVSYGGRYEKDPFATGGGPSSDFAYMLLIGSCLLWVVAYFMGMALVGPSLVFMIIYVWSRKNEDSPMGFFGFSFKGLYLPWVLMAIGILMGNDPTGDLIGIGVGHTYFFLLKIVPATYGTTVIKTPDFLFNLIEGGTVAYVPGGGAAAAGTQPRGHSWGGGRTLGSDE